jgi:1-acyl-sn-glycerol-3-phosphate acyltransferase
MELSVTLVSMRRYPWRIFATALGFIFFGAGALVLSFLVFPLLYVLPKQTRSITARWCIHKSFAIFMWAAQASGLMKFEVIGRERLKSCGGQLILANHPTLIDVVALLALIPNASCVVKQAVWKNVFFAGVVRAAAYISNAQPEGVIDACVQDMKQPRPLIIFPEGTRTVPGQALRFQRGAAYIAMKSKQNFLPVLIHCEPSTLTKGTPWYQIPSSQFTLRIQVLEPMPTSAWIESEIQAPLQARRLTAALENFFTKQMKHHEHIKHAEA